MCNEFTFKVRQCNVCTNAGGLKSAIKQWFARAECAAPHLGAKKSGFPAFAG
jgi:hypothetical protein